MLRLKKNKKNYKCFYFLDSFLYVMIHNFCNSEIMHEEIIVCYVALKLY